MHRENGYYWVRMGSHWRVGYWSQDESPEGGDWALINTPCSYRDRDFDEINETRIIRAE